MAQHPRSPLRDRTDERWMAFAACRGRGHLFFPPLAERPQARVKREARARALCDICPVQAPCKLYARVHREYGFWGGESEEGRTVAGYAVPNPIGGRRRRDVAAPAAERTDRDVLGEAS
jgi:WhiB family transcriptional regulator, redox-sensing transcriptional regulator